MHTCENINPINTKKLASSSYVVNLEKELKQARADIAELREENRILKIEISRQTTYT